MRKTIGASMATGALVLALAGCSSGGSVDAQEPLTAESAVGVWQLVDGDGPGGEVKPMEDSPITLTIESDGAFSGTSGCNNIMGTMTITDGAVDMGAIGQTLMACEDDAMKIESAYSQALDSVTAGSRTADAMTLRGDKTELHYKKG